MNSRKTVFAGNTYNQYNSDTIIKEVSDFFGQSIRTLDTRSEITSYFTHFRAEYDNTKPISAKYYRGTKPYFTNVELGVPANRSYFVIHSAPDNQRWVVWFNVDNSTVAPIVSGAKFIEINISSADTPDIIAMIAQITIRNLYSEFFTVTARNGSNIEIATTGMGVVDPSLDLTTGFLITGTPGEQELVEEVTITYIGNDPVFNGQQLKGYNFDLYSGKFVKNPEVSVQIDKVAIADADDNRLEINPDGSINVNVVSTGQQLSSFFTEVTGVATGITTELVSYTATSNVFLQKIELAGTNIAEFELTIDGVTRDKKRTFFNGNLENVFNFNQGLNILPGQIIKVFVVHNRPDVGEFTSRMQILQG